MTDYTAMTAAETRAALANLHGGARRKALRRLLYHKFDRPADLREQIDLLMGFTGEDCLTRSDHSYSVIAAAHKATELVDAERATALIPDLVAILDWAMTRPPKKALRVDGVHLRFSALNALLNAGLLVGHPDLTDWARRCRQALETIELRRVSPYIFNSTTNIVRTVALSLVIDPVDLDAACRRIGTLLFFAQRLRQADRPLFALTRRFGPARLDDLQMPSSFGKMEESMLRLGDIRHAAAQTNPEERRIALLAMAERSVGQMVPAQKAALMQAVRRNCLPT